MDLASCIFQMAADMRGSGFEIRCMVMEHFIILVANLPMKVNGCMTNLKVMELFTMKIQLL